MLSKLRRFRKGPALSDPELACGEPAEPGVRESKGFTLIELLVVITIIGILIGISLNTYGLAQKKARDVKRKADLRSLQIVLESFHQDKTSYCPTPATCVSAGTSGSWGFDCYDLAPSCAGVTQGYLSGIFSQYIPKLPHDPRNTSSNTSVDYMLYAEKNKYRITACLENLSDPDSGTPGCTPYAGWCTSGVNKPYCISNE